MSLFQVFDYDGMLGRGALKESNIPVAVLCNKTISGGSKGLCFCSVIFIHLSLSSILINLWLQFSLTSLPLPSLKGGEWASRNSSDIPCIVIARYSSDSLLNSLLNCTLGREMKDAIPKIRDDS